MSVDIGPWVLCLALLSKDLRDQAVELLGQAEERVIGKVLLGKLGLAAVTRVGLAEDSVAVAWNNLT